MLDGAVLLGLALIYLGALFAIAAWGDRRAAQGRSLISPAVYALSIAVYCTSWTFYGSVGLAASSGYGFLPVYLGPTLAFILGWAVIRKMIRICQTQRITSIADFIAARHGKSHLLAGLVTVIAVVGIMPYISLQLKAVSSSFEVLTASRPSLPFATDTAFITAVAMLIFAILFGTRHLDSSERHEGMVVAIAFESVVKLIAFLAVGLFVVFGLYDGFGDLFSQALADEALSRLLSIDQTTGYGPWIALTLLSMLAALTLPRQFQVAVIENTDERHLAKAVSLFPAYLIAINLFVLPIALGGLLTFPDGTVDADTFVLALPMSAGNEALALLVFIGGLSAATAMVVMATVALSTMVSNDLVMPILIRFHGDKLARNEDTAGLLLTIRRTAIGAVIALGYLYYRLIGESYALVSIGLVSFTAAAQFAIPMLIGMYWRDGNRMGALIGLAGGFAIWTYTLLLPSFARSGWLPDSFITDGPFGIALLKPYALFGLTDWGSIPHALFWSLLVNCLGYVIGSLLSRPSRLEQLQATLFTDVFSAETQQRQTRRTGLKTGVTIGVLEDLAARFLGRERTKDSFLAYARQHGTRHDRDQYADPDLARFTEKLLAGAIGSASARVVLRSSISTDDLGFDEVMKILDETSTVLQHSRELEEKSEQLERALADLKEANEQLQELDRLKDEFLSTVSHEMRTPLTSIRSFVEILYDNPDLELDERQHFLGIVTKEAERLTRLIEDVLQLGKLESGRMVWHMEPVSLGLIAEEAAAAVSSLYSDAKVPLSITIRDNLPPITADRDKMIQVVINLLSNAVKFVEAGRGKVALEVWEVDDDLRLSVQDNGIGIAEEAQAYIFERFRQVGDTLTEKPKGSGLGLSICQAIIDHHKGRIWVESTPEKGATFFISIPK